MSLRKVSIDILIVKQWGNQEKLMVMIDFSFFDFSHDSCYWTLVLMGHGTPCKCLQSIFLSPCSMQIPSPWPLLSWSRGNNQSRITGAIKTIHPSLFFCLSRAWDAEYWMFCCNFVIISTFQGIRTLPRRLAAAASPGLAQATLRSLDFLLRIFTSRWSSLQSHLTLSRHTSTRHYQAYQSKYKLKCLMRVW